MRFASRLSAGAVAFALSFSAVSAQEMAMTAPTTRADFVTELTLSTYPPEAFADCYGNLSPMPFTLLFKDVSITDSFGSNVCIGMLGGYINGKSDATFGPNESIPFGEVAEMISKAYGLKTFPAAVGRPRYEPYIMVLARNGAIPMTIDWPWHSVTVGESKEMMDRIANGVTSRSSHTEQEVMKWMK